ncbi:general secretion pathway protein GspB [Marinobacterium weihaiense]|uniref:General secretion pathway protein GspB n=1 Tax=Marinobacterium weihaiense TaxID=2851016 RepID=A0ABS6ME85_9GAMM|nr:general secretion pathway protein GspB [Marinobacterium weihaiense]MBV0934593.1 general secretion pathway protein GspB [Marinobacterium weihaiense]
MSYIHDALKASAERRQQVTGVGADASASTAVDTASRGWRWGPGRWLLLILLALLLYWLIDTGRQGTHVPQPGQAATGESLPRPEMSAPTAADSAPDLSGVKIELRRPSSPTPQVRSRSEASIPVTPARPVVPADDVPESVPAPPDPYADLPYLRQLPVELQRDVQGLRFSVHIYSETPASRMVKHQGRVLREGDFIRPGLRLEAIIPQGAILQYRQTRFRVPAR